jgi:hypothetical protein
MSDPKKVKTLVRYYQRDCSSDPAAGGSAPVRANVCSICSDRLRS